MKYIAIPAWSLVMFSGTPINTTFVQVLRKKSMALFKAPC